MTTGRINQVTDGRTDHNPSITHRQTSKRRATDYQKRAPGSQTLSRVLSPFRSEFRRRRREERSEPQRRVLERMSKEAMKKLPKVAHNRRKAMLLTKRSPIDRKKLIPWLFCSSSSRNTHLIDHRYGHQNQEPYYPPRLDSTPLDVTRCDVMM